MRKIANFVALLAPLALASGCATELPASPRPEPAMRTQALSGPTELLVKFRVHASPQQVERLESEYGLRQKELIAAIDVHVMTITSGEAASALADRVESSTLVAYAEPNHRLTLK